MNKIERRSIGRRKTDFTKMRFGRRPFLYGISLYEERKSTFMSPVTVTENVRKLKQFERIFTEMKQRGIIATTDPRHIGEEEIEAFMGIMRRRELSVVTRRSYIKVLNSFLTFFGNDIIERMRETGQIAIATKGEQQPIHFLDVDSLQRIFNAADVIEGPRGIMIRGYMALIFGIAGRPKEIIGPMWTMWIWQARGSSSVIPRERAAMARGCGYQ